MSLEESVPATVPMGMESQADAQESPKLSYDVFYQVIEPDCSPKGS